MSLRLKAIKSAIMLLLAVCMSACNGDGSQTEGQEVSWRELNVFDELAYRADGLARTGDLAGLRKILPQVLVAGRAVTLASAPDNAKAPEAVEATLRDLTGLVEGLSSDTLDDDSLITLVRGLHPVIERLMLEAGMPHLHANEGPHDGFLHPVFDSDGSQVGTVEIKLHDDAGDIEVWLTRGGHGGNPWRLPLDTSLALSFADLKKEVTLAVRDRVSNKDESGSSTIEEGATAYFVFPGATGADASWLIGSEFAAKAELWFGNVSTGSFILRPHVHEAGSH